MTKTIHVQMSIKQPYNDPCADVDKATVYRTTFGWQMATTLVWMTSLRNTVEYGEKMETSTKMQWRVAFDVICPLLLPWARYS